MLSLAAKVEHQQQMLEEARGKAALAEYEARLALEDSKELKALKASKQELPWG